MPRLDFTAAEELDRDAIRGVLANWCSWVPERTGIEADLVAPNDGWRGGTGFIWYVDPLRANDARDIKVDVALDETVSEMPATIGGLKGHAPPGLLTMSR